MSIKEDMLGYSPTTVSVLRPKNPVGIVPGFFCGDPVMANLAQSLKREGFRTFNSGIYLNCGFTSFQMALLSQRFQDAAKNGEKVDLIGHSLGGIYSLYLAEKYPEKIRTVITIGTPLIGDPRQAAIPFVKALGNLYLYDDLGVFRKKKLIDQIKLHSIYTTGDDVIDYRTCLDDRFNLHPVTGSHLNLPNNKQVQKIITSILLR